jgi:hypothetical protein
LSAKTVERISAIAALIILLAAWIAGGVRSKGATLERIGNISEEIVDVRQVGPSVYEGHRRGDAGDKLCIAVAEHPGYGGPVQVAVVMNSAGIIERIALVDTTDTTTYVSRVLDAAVLDAFLGTSASRPPKVDAVTGATLSSTAMIKAANKAAAHIKGTVGESGPVAVSPDEMVKAGLTVALFLAAFLISSRFFRWNKTYARLGLLTAATVILGFLYGTQPSLASLALLLAGFWTKGLASYTALICLVLAFVVFFATKKNLYCAMICPFGGLQEGLGRITKRSPPERTAWMKWISRGFALTALSAALYFRNPSDAEYTPFGMAFSFIGSTAIFALTVLILVASLVVKRPWCALLCPATPVFDYLAFMRNWLTRGRKKEKQS